MTSAAVTPDEIREGLTAFFADVELDSLTSVDVKPEELVPSSDIASARQLDASDFIIDSMDVVDDDVPDRESSAAYSNAEASGSIPKAEEQVPLAHAGAEELAEQAESSDLNDVNADADVSADVDVDAEAPLPTESEVLEASTATESALDELQLVEPLADDADLIEADYTSSLEDVVDDIPDKAFSAENSMGDTSDSIANAGNESSSEHSGAGEFVVPAESPNDIETDTEVEAAVSHSEPAVDEASVSNPALDELQLVEPFADESDLIEAEYMSSLEDVADVAEVADVADVAAVDGDDDSEGKSDVLVQADPDTESAVIASDDEIDPRAVEADSDRSTGDTLIDELSVHAVLMDDVDIDLFGDDADTSDTSSSDTSPSDSSTFDSSKADTSTSEAFDSTVNEHDVDGQDFVEAGTIETDLDHSVQLVAGELQPVVSSGLVVNQKTAEIAEYYPAIDPLDSTQSDFDLDIPDAPVPGGFLRRWYIRGAAYVKRMWRRIRRAKTDPQA